MGGCLKIAWLENCMARFKWGVAVHRMCRLEFVQSVCLAATQVDIGIHCVDVVLCSELHG